MVLLEFVAIFQCNPVAKAWNPTITYGHCINTRALFTFSSVLAIVTDLLTLIPPIWVFSKMNIRGRLKVVVLATFLLGFVVTALSCWRLYSLVRVLYFPDTIPDFFFDISFVSSTFEINIAIITASVPALRALVTKGISARYPGVLPIANQAARPRDGEFPLSIGSQPFRLILRKVHDSILHPTHQREQPLALAESINETTNTTTRFPSVGTGGSTAVAASNDLGPDRVSRDKRGSVGRCIGYQD